MRSLFVAAVLVVVVARPSAASDEHHDEAQVHHRHHVSVLLGGAVRSEHGETESGFGLGAEYEYRIHPLVGAGALVEVASGSLRDVIVASFVAVHPWRGLLLVAGPGAEIPNEGDAEFLFRLGIAYHFTMDRFTVGPDFNVDLVNGHPTYVIGLAFGVGF
jgi:hypothetical protein